MCLVGAMVHKHMDMFGPAMVHIGVDIFGWGYRCSL